MDVCLLTRYFNTNNTEGVGIGKVSGELYKHLVGKNIYLYPIACGSGGLFTYFTYSLLEIPHQIMNLKFDVYHALTPVESLWIPKEKSIVTIHDLFSLVNVKAMGSGVTGNSLIMKLAQAYYQKACNEAVKCKRIVCVSEKTKTQLVSLFHLNPERVKVIHSGISSNLKPKKREHTDFSIGYLGALDRRKRVNLLLEAFIKSKIEASLIIGGQGLEEEKLRDIARSNTRNNILFMGYIPELDINDFYNSLDLFIFPTSMEGYGLPLIEAMACGKPTVVLEDSDIPAEIKKRCIVVKDLTDFLEDLNTSKEILKEVDLESNLKFAETHKWENTAKEYYKLYEEIYNK